LFIFGRVFFLSALPHRWIVWQSQRVLVALLFKFYGIVVALFLIFHTADIFGPGIGALRPSVASFVLNLSNGHRIDISFQVLVFNIPRPSLSNQSDYYPLSL